MTDAGYLPKVIVATPDGLTVKRVREICSVSHCISPTVEQWLSTWRHNDFGWFNCIEDAWAVVPEPERARYRLFAYRVAPVRFRKGERLPVSVPENAHPVAIPSSFVSLGFDGVSKSMESAQGFECSPLSCNAMAGEVRANEHCLFATIEAAIEGAESFSRQEPESGDYYVVEVLEERITEGRRTSE